MNELMQYIVFAYPPPSGHKKEAPLHEYLSIQCAQEKMEQMEQMEYPLVCSMFVSRRVYQLQVPYFTYDQETVNAIESISIQIGQLAHLLLK